MTSSSRAGWPLPVLMAFTLLSVVPADADALPVFARRYKVSCSLCHNPIPRLTPFGDQFAANGFRMSPGEAPQDTTATGDPLLSLMKEFPLAVRLDAYAQVYANGSAATDFQTPYALKILSSGPLSDDISYYFYAFLSERGEVGGIEDAFLYVNDIGGQPVDLAVGQFQVSDPLFKRELRLEFEDYAVYRARLGDVPTDLTYDRGIMAMVDLAGFSLTGELVNGNGKGAAQDNRRFDVDANKNVFLRISRDLPGGFRLGAFGLYGRSQGNNLHNSTNMYGFDGSFTTGPLEVNAQFVHRKDDRPTFTAGEPTVRMDGGFAEVIVQPQGSRFYGFGLYNLVSADRPLLDVRLGGPADVRRYESISAGVGHLIRRNLRVTAEGTWNLEEENTRWTLGFVSAF
ncbi:MAG: hypothetical protein AB7I33_14170 [Gemmatimonadales bacterium]